MSHWMYANIILKQVQKFLDKFQIRCVPVFDTCHCLITMENQSKSSKHPQQQQLAEASTTNNHNNPLTTTAKLSTTNNKNQQQQRNTRTNIYDLSFHNKISVFLSKMGGAPISF